MLEPPVLIRKMGHRILIVGHSPDEFVVVCSCEPVPEQVITHSWRSLGVHGGDIESESKEMGS